MFWKGGEEEGFVMIFPHENSFRKGTLTILKFFSVEGHLIFPLNFLPPPLNH